jgi:CDP-4-dehydro-6-deoxyglucose reductase
MREGDRIHARGPLGTFTMRSPVDQPLVFVAGGTGFAPIEALIEQQLKLTPQRDMLVFWGAADLRDFYALDVLEGWNRQDGNLRITLAAEHGLGASSTPAGIPIVKGRVAKALQESSVPIAGHDVYVAGPPAMIRAVLDVLHGAGVSPDRIHVDSFGAA